MMNYNPLKYLRSGLEMVLDWLNKRKMDALLRQVQEFNELEREKGKIKHGEFTRDQILETYAFYGVGLSGVEEIKGGRLEDVILTALKDPPPGRVIGITPALIIKNEDKIDFEYLVEQASKTTETEAMLGFVLDIASNCCDERMRRPDYKVISEKLANIAKRMKPSDKVVVWLPEELKKAYNEKELVPEFPYEKRWNVKTFTDFEGFRRHCDSYVRYKFTKEEVEKAYAFYGVPINRETPMQIGPIEEVVLSTIHRPQSWEEIAALTALIVKNEKIIDFDYLLRRVSEFSGGTLGFVFEIGSMAIREEKKPADYERIAEKLERIATKLKPEKANKLWIPEKERDLLKPADLVQKDSMELKWNVKITFEVDNYKRNIKEYIRRSIEVN